MPTLDSSDTAGHDQNRTQPEVRGLRQTRRTRTRGRGCTDPVVGAILAGWRFDISGLSPEMRVDYETHLAECSDCHRRRNKARTIDVLLIAVSSLMIVAFLLAILLIHRIHLLERIDLLHLQVHDTAVDVSLQAVAVVGLLVSIVLWVLVAIATPLPSFFSDVLQERLPSELLERFARRHA